MQKYKMGGELVFADGKAMTGFDEINHGGSIKSGLWNAMTGLTISMDDLVRGKQISCKEITEMLAMKHEIFEACKTFKRILDAAINFEGGEVVEL